jgi:phosphatidylglycerophosphatase A
VGSLATLPLFLVIAESSAWIYWSVTLTVSALGFWASERCSQLLGQKDPSSVVIDEAAGVLIAMGMVRHSELPFLAASWMLFRLLDIKKPWLIDRVQHLRPNGVGIMADDLLAGAVAGAVCRLLVAFVPSP